MLNRGFYFAPSQFEAGFVSSAHARGDVEATVSAFEDVFSRM
jgi:glutamate-1-semialdehyde 2,1-aminomutase